MDSIIHNITSRCSLISIERNFKLCAGPGAGKTTFLVNHIHNILKNSQRLGITKKILCITYTNIGVESISKKLKHSIDNVEISTIHKFLYRNVVKPYSWLIKDKYEIPLDKLQGHRNIEPRFNIIKQWIDTYQTNLYGDELDDVKNDLERMKWDFGDDKTINLKIEWARTHIKFENLIEFKRLCWRDGLISHDDVLFLAYEILKENPRVLDILRAKFPYIFVDEFQDTSPIQAEILKMIGEKESIIGVIGDFGQSIYKFQGADVEKFNTFLLDGMDIFEIKNNHRSTSQIINVLNYIRNDSKFHQKSPENKQGIIPIVIVGPQINAYKLAKKISNNDGTITLAHLNKTANSMRFKVNGSSNIIDINEITYKKTDPNRARLIKYVIKSIEYCKEQKISEAIEYMDDAFRKNDNIGEKEVLIHLQNFINKYDEYKDLSMKDFYNDYINSLGIEESKLTYGGDFDYFESITYRQVAMSIKIHEDNVNIHKTIHSSKGDEFNSLMIIIPEETKSNLNFIIEPNMSKELCRIYYVALSRAKEYLFINVTDLSYEDEKKLENIGFEIKEI